MHDAYPYLRGLIYNQPLMATPALADLADEWARAILIDGRERLFVEASAAQTKVLAPDAIKAAGVAVIPVHGALVPRGNTMTACMGTSSYDRIGAQLDAALADPEVRQIALDIDSPGGSVQGAFELAGKIAQATKPTTSIVNFNALSAAYLLASACDSVSVSSTGAVGSVGVVAMHRDLSGANDKAGVKITAVYRGDKKLHGASHAPLSEVAQQELQAQVDDAFDQFVAAVSTHRNLPADRVVGLQAGVFHGADALSQGLADQMETPQEAIDRLAGLVQAGAAQQRQQTQRRQAMTLRAQALEIAARL